MQRHSVEGSVVMAKWTSLGSAESTALEDRAESLPTSEEMMQETMPDRFIADLSDGQRAAYWQRVGRFCLDQSRYEEALSAFGWCALFLDRSDAANLVSFQRSRASAACRGHHYTEAIVYFEELGVLWERLIAENQTASCVAEDAQAFLCSIYRQLAQCWLYRGSPGTARSILEHRALPLVEKYFAGQCAPPYQPATSQSEKNWREMLIFVPWLLNTAICWEARLNADPAQRESALFMGYAAVLRAARLSQIIPEARQWSPSLYTSAAETMILRCRLSRSFALRQATYRAARFMMSQAKAAHERLGLKEADISPVLRLPELELGLCAMRASDTLYQAEALLEKASDLRDEASADPDPSSQLLAARCAWLMGTIEIDFAEGTDDANRAAAARSRAYWFYLQALSLLPEADEASLNKRGIEADLERLSVTH
jgi:hypothetical protein